MVKPVFEKESEEDVEITPEPEKKAKANPAILIKEAVQFDLVRGAFKEAWIESECKAVQGGVWVFTWGSEDFRRALKNIKESGTRTHWYMLEEEKPLRMVIKGVPAGLEEELVKEELTGIGFNIESVVRINRDKENPYDMVAVTSERSEEEKSCLR